MNKLVLLLGAMALTGLTLYSLTNFEDKSLGINEFKEFKIRFNKSYGTENENTYRFNIFKKNLLKIKTHNESKKFRYTLGINQFTDLTFSEFKSRYLQKPIPAPELSGQDFKYDNSFKAPRSFDWREQEGAVGAIKNQGSCGSCWAFSAISTTENAIWRTSKRSVNLSEQELVDCAWLDENQGCNGGFPHLGLKYILENNVSLSSSYPYIGVDQKCNKKNKNKSERLGIKYYEFVSGDGSPAYLKYAITKGVVSVSIEVQENFQLYHSGVYHNDNPYCGTKLNHAVNLVGFSDDNSDPYYILRNSWAETWGNKGYMNISYGNSQTGTCGIANSTDVIAN
jgi:C1A family cysteine protease